MALQRVAVKLGDVLPNPYKKDVCGGRLDPKTVRQLEESVREMGFWDNLLCRRNGKGVELAYGHHRLRAATNVLGKGAETSIALADLTDGGMIKAMARENGSGEDGEESTQAQIDTVLVARKYFAGLIKPAKRCECGASMEQSNSARRHEPGSTHCLASFLGWSHTQVTNLMGLHERLHPDIKAQIESKVSSSSAMELSRLSEGKDDVVGKRLQKKIFDVIKTAPKKEKPTFSEMRRVVKEVKAAPPAKRAEVAVRAAREVVRDAKRREARADDEREVKKKPTLDLDQWLWKVILPPMRQSIEKFNDLLVQIRNLKLPDDETISSSTYMREVRTNISDLTRQADKLDTYTRPRGRAANPNQKALGA